MSTETLNYKLKQWESSDKPTMADFNADNKKIDDALKSLSENKANIEDVPTKAEIGAFFAEYTTRFELILQAQDVKINELEIKFKLLNNMLNTDIQENKTVVMFDDLSGISLIKGVYNQAYSRIEC